MAVVPLMSNPNGGGAKLDFPFAVADDAAYSATGAGGAATAIVLTGVTGKPILLSQVAWSYSAAPTGGAITIADGTISRTLDITAAGPGFWYFDPPLSFTAGATLTVTLAAPGGAVVGKVSVVTWIH